MKVLKTMLALVVLVASVAIVRAITVNPASAVTADSAATGLTIPYRDANGDFAVNDLTLADLTATGSITLTMPAVQTIGAGGTIAADACGGVKRITSTAARTTDTTNTFTAPAAANAGCAMDVVNVSQYAITLDNNANFNSSGTANVVLGSSDTIRVVSTGASGMWYEMGSSDN